MRNHHPRDTTITGVHHRYYFIEKLCNVYIITKFSSFLFFINQDFPVDDCTTTVSSSAASFVAKTASVPLLTIISYFLSSYRSSDWINGIASLGRKSGELDSVKTVLPVSRPVLFTPVSREERGREGERQGEDRVRIAEASGKIKAFDLRQWRRCSPR